ncbi:MAG: 50S ribosomal protein L11 methyltransferase [Synergistaceae bacterium]|nr:50S ribosomal protein L11 methyltransferase [Synergistaceae bacterium]
MGLSEKADDSNFWWSIELEAEGAEAEVEETLSTVADLSGSIGAEIFGEKEKMVLRGTYLSSQDLFHWLSVLDALLPNFPGVRVRSHAKVENQDWQKQHLDAFPPFSVGVNLVVMAPWHRGKEPAGKTPLYIYPGSAFGTGYHESTQIALSLVERFIKAGDTVMDVGTGSGVLFIAALKLGALKATARDIDPTAISEARRNMDLNGLPSSACNLQTGNLVEGLESRADVLMANILLDPNLRLLKDVPRVLNPSGITIFTGMTVSERPSFLSALVAAKLSLLAELTQEDWWGCVARRT